MLSPVHSHFHFWMMLHFVDSAVVDTNKHCQGSFIWQDRTFSCWSSWDPVSLRNIIYVFIPKGLAVMCAYIWCMVGPGNQTYNPGVASAILCYLSHTGPLHPLHYVWAVVLWVWGHLQYTQSVVCERQPHRMLGLVQVWEETPAVCFMLARCWQRQL